MRQQKIKFQKSVPLFFEFSSLPNSTVVKVLLREILKELLEPIPLDEVKKLKQRKKGRKRVYLTFDKDKDLIDFFFKTPRNIQYAVFLKLNQKLKEVLP